MHQYDLFFLWFFDLVTLELLFFQRSREIFDQLLGKQLLLIHIVIIETDRVCDAASDGIRRHLCAVEPTLDIQRLIHAGVYADANADTMLAAVIVLYAYFQLFRKPAVIGQMRTIDEKCVRAAPANDTAGVFHQLQRPICHPSENSVAESLSIAFIDRVEVIDVNYQRVCLHILMVVIQQYRIMIEKVSVIQVRQVIALCPTKGIPVFGQFYDTPNARKYDFPLRIRLGNEIDRAERKTVHSRLYQIESLGLVLREGVEPSEPRF